MAGEPNGRLALEVRIQRAERDIAELFGRVNDIAEKLAQIPYLTQDIAEIKADCAKTREWVEQKMSEQKASEAERARLSAGQKVAIIGAIAVVIASIIGAIASLASAGAFG